MAQQPASVYVTSSAGKALAASTADYSSNKKSGILKTPRSCLNSAAGGAAVGPATALGLDHSPNVDTFFLKLDGDGCTCSTNEPGSNTSSSCAVGGQKQQKRALFVDPVCQPGEHGVPTRSSKTPSCYGPDSVRNPSGSGSQTSRSYTPAQSEAHVVLPFSARAHSKHPLLQQRLVASDHGSSKSSRQCQGAVSPDHVSSRSNLCSRSSLLLPEPSSSWRSCCSTPHCKSSSSSNSCSGGSPRLQSRAGGSTSDNGSGNSSGCGSAASARQYGTAWYLKTSDWDHITHKVQPGSTWHRESVYLEELDEQHRFAQQLSDPNSSSGISTSTSTNPPVGALAAAVQGFSSPGEALSALSPALRASNTWAMSKKGILDVAAADAAAAASTVQYYKQLQEVAQQQAAMNEKVKGTFALRAYKEFMRAKGYRQAASLQRLPTPTDEDMRLVKVRAQQQLKRQQQHLRLHGHQQHQQQGSQLQQQMHQIQQHQQRAAEGRRASAVGAAAAAAGAPAAAAAAAVGAAVSADAMSGELLPGSATASSAAGTAATQNSILVPKLDLSGINQVTKQLHELKSSCHPGSGLDGSDWQMLEVLLTSGRQAMLTARAAATAAAAAASSHCDSYSLPGSSSSSSRTGTPGGCRPPWQSCCNGSSSSRLQVKSRDAAEAAARSRPMGSDAAGITMDGRSSWGYVERHSCGAEGARTGVCTTADVAAAVGEVTMPPVVTAADDASLSMHCRNNRSCSSPASNCSKSSSSRCSEGSEAAAETAAHCCDCGSQLRGQQQQQSPMACAEDQQGHEQQQQQQQQQDDVEVTTVPEGLNLAGEVAAAAIEPTAAAATGDRDRATCRQHGFASTDTYNGPSSVAQIAQFSAAKRCDVVAEKAIAGRCIQQQQQQSPRLASRGGTGRLSPYGNALLEEIPVHINYTLTRGASGSPEGRASPVRLSTDISTPRSARGSGATAHRYVS